MAKYFPELATCFLGALLETGFYVICTGFATKFGGSYPSSNHVNGEAVDTSYFSLGKTPSEKNAAKKRDDETNKVFVRSLNKYHFDEMFVYGNYSYLSNLGSYISLKKYHGDHLHSGMKRFKEKEKKK